MQRERLPQSTVVDLGRLHLSSGEAAGIDLLLAPQALELGGESYATEARSFAARLDVSRTTSGYALRLRFSVRLEGPCMRCLDDAGVAVDVDAREVDQPASADDELLSPYVDGDELEVARWAHDAVALAAPGKVLCRAECAGLCAVCGERLGAPEDPEHRHGEQLDPRWAKLRELRPD